MARPLRRNKKIVDLESAGPAVSRIRRNPPPAPPKKISPSELRAREARIILAGLLACGLLIAVILFQFGYWAGWSPSDHVILIEAHD